MFECWGVGVGGGGVYKNGKKFVPIQKMNVTWICQTKKNSYAWGLKKFTNGYLGIHTDGLKCPKPLTDGG